MTAIVRFSYAVLGTLSLLLGAIGVVLPVMPGTVFLILAAWAFARSVPAVHRWLHANRWIGPALRRWERERCVERSTKRLATAMLALSAVAAAVTLARQPLLLLALLAVLGAVLAYLHTRATCQLQRQERTQARSSGAPARDARPGRGTSRLATTEAPITSATTPSATAIGIL
jgi:hypothetical protein